MRPLCIGCAFEVVEQADATPNVNAGDDLLRQAEEIAAEAAKRLSLERQRLAVAWVRFELAHGRPPRSRSELVDRCRRLPGTRKSPGSHRDPSSSVTRERG
jgi:hypothetical protein